MGREAHHSMNRELHDCIADDLIAKGLLVEAGFAGLRSAVIARDAPQVQIDEMRMAFFAGAQHLFASIMSTLDPDEEPTEADLQRMSQIATELEAFGKTFALRATPTGRRQ